MTEDEAILFLLDLAEGAQRRLPMVMDKVTEIQESCGIEEGDEKKLQNRLEKSNSVSLEMGRFRLR